MKNSAISISTIIAILMAILCMFSCSRHSAHWNTLRHADACMEEHPDKTRVVLCDVRNFLLSFPSSLNLRFT